MKSLAGSSLVMTIALLICPVTSANAGPSPTRPEARRHLAAGNKLYEIKSFEEAIAEYKQGALIESSAIFHYNLGQCYRQLGRYEDAIWHYEQFLAKASPEGEVLEAINGFIAQMRSELDKKAMTQLPTEVAQTPLESPPRRAESPPPTRRWYQDPIALGLTGTGVVGMGLGVGFLLKGMTVNDDANHSPVQTTSRSLHQSADRWQLGGAVVGIVGGGLFVAGFVKCLWPEKSRSQTPALSFDPAHKSLYLWSYF